MAADDGVTPSPAYILPVTARALGPATYLTLAVENDGGSGGGGGGKSQLLIYILTPLDYARMCPVKNRPAWRGPESATTNFSIFAQQTCVFAWRSIFILRMTLDLLTFSLLQPEQAMYLFLVIAVFAKFARTYGECHPCRACAWEGLMDAVPHFVTDQAGCRSNETIVDLTKFSEVYDLTCCPTGFSRAYYHKLVDCMYPSLLALHGFLQSSAISKVALLPDHLSSTYDILLTETSPRQRKPHRFASSERACYIISTNESLVSGASQQNASPAEAWTTFYNTMHRNLVTLSQVDVVSSIKSTASKAKITVIQRQGRGRAFANLDEILTAFKSAFPTWDVQVFHGTESVAQTMGIFSQSRVIVGYHGAGLANALFTPLGTVVLEYTTMSDINSTTLWRSNAGLAKMHPDLTWIQHAVDVDRLDQGPGKGTATNAVRATRNSMLRDQLIKQAPHVHISDAVLFNSINRLKVL